MNSASFTQAACIVNLVTSLEPELDEVTSLEPELDELLSSPPHAARNAGKPAKPTPAADARISICRREIGFIVDLSCCLSCGLCHG
jgi:hypothetical protein